jgi:hypothetical protein
VTSQFPTFVSHRSSAFLRVIRLMILETQLSAVFHDGSRVICHSFLNLRLCFGKFSRPGTSLLMFKSVILLVAILYAEAIDAVNKNFECISELSGACYMTCQSHLSFALLNNRPVYRMVQIMRFLDFLP